VAADAAAGDAIQEAETLLAVAPAEYGVRHPELEVLLLAARRPRRAGRARSTRRRASPRRSDGRRGCEQVKIECLGRLALIEAYRGRLSRPTRWPRQARRGAEEHACSRGGAVSASWRSPGSGRTLRRRGGGPHFGRAAVPAGRDGTAVTAYAIVKSRRLLARVSCAAR